MDVSALKSRLKSYTVIRDHKTAILYNKEKLQLVPIEYRLGLQLEQLLTNLEGVSDHRETLDKLERIANCFDKFEFKIPRETEGADPCAEENHNACDDKTLSGIPPNKYLYKIAINVSNMCNLRCQYCYANQGVFETPAKFLMRPDEIEAAINRFAERFDYIENVQFMGGEPSLNPKALEKTAQVFKRLVEEKKLAAMPKHMGMVSNGVSFTREFFEVVKRNHLGITFSLDGPKEVHDGVRIKPGGKGSYDSIRENIKRIQEIGTQYSFEATFSKQHLHCGMHLADLCQWFFEEWGVRVLHAPTVQQTKEEKAVSFALTPQEELEEMCDVTAWGLENLQKGQYLIHGFTERLLESFGKRRKNARICAAGSGLLSVSAKGDVFPCFMLTDQKPFYMGNVHRDDFLSQRAAAVLQVMDQFDLLLHPACQDCWVQPVCFGCKGCDWFTTDSLNIKSHHCDVMRAMVATFVLRLHDLLQATREKEA